MVDKKVWLITGGSRGIGKVILNECVNAGNIGIFCARSVNTESGIRADVSDYSECQRVVEEVINKFGRIDVLVNNAGVYGPIGKLDNISIDEWNNAIQINLLGTVNCTKLVLPIMKKQGHGKIINLAGAGVGGNKIPSNFSAYFTSKMAVAGFTEVVAAELKEDNIQINCISPGGVNTFFTDYLLESGEEKAGKEMYEQAKKQKENGGDNPLMAAKLVLFLASSESDHISGKILSAKWDSLEKMKDKKYFNNNLYNLRRIDDFLFYEK